MSALETYLITSYALLMISMVLANMIDKDKPFNLLTKTFIIFSTGYCFFWIIILVLCMLLLLTIEYLIIKTKGSIK